MTLIRHAVLVYLLTRTPKCPGGRNAAGVYFYNMKYILPIILIALSSCGKLKRTASTSDTEIKAEKEGTFNMESIATETADTLITLAPDTSTWSIPAWMFTDSSVLIIETPRQVIEFEYSPATRNVNVKAVVKSQVVPIKIDRTQVLRIDSTYHERVKVNVETTDKETKKTQSLIPWWMWIVAVILAALWVGWKFLRG